MHIRYLFIVMILVMGLASAEVQSLPTQKVNTNVTLTQTCSNCTFVNLTSVKLPNSTEMNIDKAMTKNGVKYNYSYYVSSLGTYIVTTCGDVDGTLTCVDYDFEVSTSGIASNEARSNALSRSTYIIIFIGILLFAAFIFSNSSEPIKWTFFILSITFLLIGLNLVSISMRDEILNESLINFFDSFTAITFYLYWFMAGLLALLWIYTILNTYFYKQNLQAAQRFGQA